MDDPHHTQVLVGLLFQQNLIISRDHDGILRKRIILFILSQPSRKVKPPLLSERGNEGMKE